MSSDWLAEYLGYAPKSASIIPAVGAGLSAAGLLSSLYGGYQQQQNADRGYREQKREFEAQKQMQDAATQRDIAQQGLGNEYTAKSAVESDNDRLLKQYSDYYRSIGK